MYFEIVQPLFLKNIKFFNEKVLLFTKFKIDTQLETIFCRNLKLPSGGLLVIDYTEALISIDVNSAKSTNTLNVEGTAVKNNLEAVTEIARQLKLRDLGGIIIIDFIDMGSIKNKNALEKRLIRELEEDKAKIIVGSISRFGLLELSRQRTKKTVFEFSEQTCLQCDGKGTIPSVETMSLFLLQRLQSLALKFDVKCIDVILSLNFFNFFLQRWKVCLCEIEEKFNIKINFFTDFSIIFPHYKIYTRRDSKKVVLLNKNDNSFNRIIFSTTPTISIINLRTKFFSKFILLLNSIFFYVFTLKFFLFFLRRFKKLF